MLAKISQFVHPVRDKLPLATVRRLWRLISNGVKKHQEDIILVIGVILISLLSFAAGYIIARQQERTPIKFEQIQN